MSEEQKAKAIETQEVWVLTWYPDTPVGHFQLLACDLDVLLADALEVQAEDDRRTVRQDGRLTEAIEEWTAQ